MISGKKVLITGGLGFIGSTLAHSLVKEGACVTLLDSFEKNSGSNRFNIQGIEKEVDIIQGSMNDEKLIKKAVAERDVIFNLAGQRSHTESILNPSKDLANNLTNHIVFLEACRHSNHAGPIIFASTRGVYGKAEYLPVDESHALHPQDANGINKLAAEKYHELYAKLHGLNTCCLRFSNVYGPRHQMKVPNQGVINWFVRQAIEDEQIVLFKGGRNLRDVVYVEDVVSALLLVIENSVKGKIYNVTEGYPRSLKEMAETIVKVVGKGSVREAAQPRAVGKVEVGDFYADNARITALGWMSKTSFEEGIKKTVSFYDQFRSKYW